MFLFEVTGSAAARLRSFAFSGGEELTRLKSTRKLASLHEVRENLTDRTLLLFVEKKHLPPDFDSGLRDLPGYEHLRYVVFCEGISWLKAGDVPPRSAGDRADATYGPCLGFSATTPVPDAEVELKDAYSFGEKELKDLLGEFYSEAGHLIFLSLPPEGPIEGRFRGIMPTLLEMLG